MLSLRCCPENDEMCCEKESGTKQVPCKSVMRNGDMNMKHENADRYARNVKKCVSKMEMEIENREKQYFRVKIDYNAP